MSARSRRRLTIAALLAAILCIAAYTFRDHVSYLWMQSSTVPQMNSLFAVQTDGVDIFEARVVRRIPHNRKHFVQGLQFDGDMLWEGTGLYGQSKLIKYRFDRAAGIVESVYETALPADIFGEGLAVLKGILYQLTWKEGHVYRYDLSGTQPLPLTPLSNDREGWGLTTDGQHLIASDGSAFLTFRSITDFYVAHAIEVQFQGKAIDRLNELEWIDGKVWANVWMTPFIVVGDPATGNVTSIIDCRALVEDAKASDPDIDVLNGIAWNVRNRELYLTGKLWPWIYQVVLDKKPSP